MTKHEVIIHLRTGRILIKGFCVDFFKIDGHTTRISRGTTLQLEREGKIKRCGRYWRLTQVDA